MAFKIGKVYEQEHSLISFHASGEKESLVHTVCAVNKAGNLLHLRTLRQDLPHQADPLTHTHSHTLTQSSTFVSQEKCLKWRRMLEKHVCVWN